MYFPAEELVNPAGDRQHQYRAGQGGQDDGPEFGFDDVQAEHQPHAGRHEEKAHIGNQEIAQAFDPFQFDPFQFQEQGEQQHPGNASRQRESGQIDEKLA